MTTYATEINFGREISIQEANRRKDQYKLFKQYHGLLDQTEYIDFSLGPLMEWLEKVKDKTDTIRIFLAQMRPDDPNSADRLKLNVVLWPYKEDQPAQDTGLTVPLLNPYNVGNRQPGLPEVTETT
jgi:hypothetical protein